MSQYPSRPTTGHRALVTASPMVAPALVTPPQGGNTPGVLYLRALDTNHGVIWVGGPDVALDGSGGGRKLNPGEFEPYSNTRSESVYYIGDTLDDVLITDPRA